MCNPVSFLGSVSKQVVVERRGLWLAPLSLFLTSCMSVEQIAPTVTSAPGSSSAVLAEGRSIYTRQCTACHTAEPVSAYTAAQWREILPRMSEETKLNPAQSRAVEAYVFAALNVRPAAAR